MLSIFGSVFCSDLARGKLLINVNQQPDTLQAIF